MLEYESLPTLDYLQYYQMCTTNVSIFDFLNIIIVVCITVYYDPLV